MEWTEDQQIQINKLVGAARKEGRQSGIEQGKEDAQEELDQLQSQLSELEKVEGQAETLTEALEEYNDFVDEELEGLDGAVKSIVEQLPDKLTALEKLTFARNLDTTSEPSPGTPKRPTSSQDDPDPAQITL